MAIEHAIESERERRLSSQQAQLLSILALLPIIMLLSNLSSRYLGSVGSWISLLLPVIIPVSLLFTVRLNVREFLTICTAKLTVTV